MKLLAVATGVMLALLGCSSGQDLKGETLNNSPTGARKMASLPAFVEQAMKTPFPADGEIHVVSKQGQFEIGQKVIFCDLEIGSEVAIAGWSAGRFGIDGALLSKVFEYFKQVQNQDGSSRQKTFDDIHCRSKNNTVLYSGQIFSNREGLPYKLVLAVWQTDSKNEYVSWVGGIERINEDYPLFNKANWIGKEEIVSRSIELDVENLGTYFVNDLMSAKDGS